ncbi:catalase family protein [Novosphingobium terrae]|uniref:catalase family protein n=1 Tax=Novosphingobium terrae TaxID=2726189 RepID=UPI00198137B9|nr:catalase family protein [Novosphingobium terrae]
MQPLPFSPDVEVVELDEPQTQAELIEAFRKISETTHQDTGHGFRAVHAKSHALLSGQLRVLAALPPEFAQGIFATERDYDVLLRISTNAGDVLPDTISLQRGFAIKVLDVDGERLPGSQDARTQDFLMANGAAFPSAGPKPFLQSLKLLAATTDKLVTMKEVISAAFRTIEKGIEALGGESALLLALGGKANTNPLGERFFSQAPIRYGAYMAKIALRPRSENFKALEGKDLDIAGRENALREEIGNVLVSQGGQWELCVQLCRDLTANPIEDASVPWPEDDNPYVPVAVISVGPQPAWTLARAAVLDDETSFSPWHGITDHRPLGGIMRMRKPAYEASAQMRGQFNGCPMHEPLRVNLPG